MKINLGCGGEHKKGYLNVDGFDSTIADELMEAIDLKIEDNSAEEIFLSQVIEHLGIQRCLYALGECFRVLKPGGKVVIETPDIRASFKKYLDGDREDRKYVLPWIYGVDLPGMQHKFCFPEDLIKEELTKIGFENINTSKMVFDEHQPILRVECEKPADYKAYQLIALLRKKLLETKKIALDNQIVALEQENLIEFLTEKLKTFLENKDKKILDEIFIHGGVLSPRITYSFFELLNEQKIIDLNVDKKFLSKLFLLDKNDLVDNLVNSLAQIPDYIANQLELVEKVINSGEKITEQLLLAGTPKDDDVVKHFENVENLGFSYQHDFFSEKLIMLKAYKLFQRGVKFFNTQSFEKSIEYFTKSWLLYRDQILTYWNLARLYRLCGKEEDAQSFYDKCLQVLSNMQIDREEVIKELIKKEKAGEKENYRSSLISLRQVYEEIDNV